MVYFSGIHSLIESVYLNDLISKDQYSCSVVVNPENVKYLVGKTVIINSLEYDLSKVSTILKNRNQVISRVKLDSDNSNIILRPYILRINNHIMWNGRIIEECNDISKLLDQDDATFDLNSGRLYFPKIIKFGERVYDDFNNLSCLGWALQQIGINIKDDTVFENLDIIKTGKCLC